MLAQQSCPLSETAELAFRDHIERRPRQPRFANTRSVRNALDRARLRQAMRPFESPDGLFGVEDPTTVGAEAIGASRVFKGGMEASQPVPDTPS